MSDYKLNELRKLATEAIAGPWHQTDSNDPHWLREVRDVEGNQVAWCGRLRQEEAHAISAYIAAANPEAILSLLDQRDALLEAIKQALASIAQGETTDTWNEYANEVDRAREILEAALPKEGEKE